jgi:hypothetical protein
MQGASSKYYLMGLLTGLSFWMQQDSLLHLSRFYFIHFIHRRITSGQPETKALGMTGGFTRYQSL